MDSAITLTCLLFLLSIAACRNAVHCETFPDTVSQLPGSPATPAPSLHNHADADAVAAIDLYEDELVDEATKINDGSTPDRDRERLPRAVKSRIVAGKDRVRPRPDLPSDDGYSNEYRIKHRLLLHYDKTTQPVRDENATTTLHVGMSLYHILDTNEKYQTLSALIAVRLRWVDEYLKWNASKYGGLEQVWIPAEQVWTPDIFISNFADGSFQDFMNTYVIVSSSGHVLWMFPAVVKVYCTLDVEHFPFDNQRCPIVFISWTFNGFKLNVTYNESEQQVIYYTPRNQEWFVSEVTVSRHEKIYACCPEPYPDVSFTIHMTRRSLFYVVNLIFPCLLIYAVSFLGFFLPVESGDKVNLEITILLALVVFLLIVGETLPPTPDAIPALGLLFGLTMVMVSIALVMAVIVTNIYLRKDSSSPVPGFARRLLLRRGSQAYRKVPTIIVSGDRSRCEKSFPPPPPPPPSPALLEKSSELVDMDSLSVLSDAETTRRRSSSTSSAEAVGQSSTTKESSLTDGRQQLLERRRAEFAQSRAAFGSTLCEDWLQLSKIVDRIFFWSFLFISLGSLTAMFSRIPP